MLQVPFVHFEQVERMAKQLGVAEGQVYTCETAAYFWLLHVLSRWEKFLADVAARKTPACVQDLFPFKVGIISPGSGQEKQECEPDYSTLACVAGLHNNVQDLFPFKVGNSAMPTLCLSS